jgi:TonB family protein
LYDAPETAAGVALPESDVWSLGAILVAAFTQNVSLEDNGGQREPGLPRGIPDPFRGIVRECLHLDPKRRCSLQEIQARLQPSARSVPAPVEAPAPVRKNHYRLTWRMFIPIALLLVPWLLWRVLHKPAPPVTSHNIEFAQTPPESSQPAPSTVPKPISPAQKPAEPAKTAHASAGAVLHQVLPEPPHSAMNTITGTIKVAVRVQVDPSGKVTEATFKSAGSSKYFAEQALKAAQRWEFTAPEVDGQPSASTWLLQFRFKRGGIQVSPEQMKR